MFTALDLASSLKERANLSIKTTRLNSLLQQSQASQRHPSVGKKQVKVFYATQTQISPQTFTLFCNYPELIKPSYLNFLTNNIRSHFGLFGVPIRLKVRKKSI